MALCDPSYILPTSTLSVANGCFGKLKQQQLAFLDTFGYLEFPGLLLDCIDRITEEFEAVFAVHGGGHDGKQHDGSARSCIVPLLSTRASIFQDFSTDPRIEGIFFSLLGEDFNYLGSDGNFYEINAFARFWVDSVFGEAMLRTAGPKRMVHLQQVLDHQDCLAEAVREAKSRMTEPSRG